MCVCKLMENNSSQRVAHVSSNNDYSAATKLEKYLYICMYIHMYVRVCKLTGMNVRVL